MKLGTDAFNAVFSILLISRTFRVFRKFKDFSRKQALGWW